jgi:hypothetical protein
VVALQSRRRGVCVLRDERYATIATARRPSATSLLVARSSKHVDADAAVASCGSRTDGATQITLAAVTALSSNESCGSQTRRAKNADLGPPAASDRTIALT